MARSTDRELSSASHLDLAQPLPLLCCFGFCRWKVGVANPKAALESKEKGSTTSISIPRPVTQRGRLAILLPELNPLAPRFLTCLLLCFTPVLTWGWGGSMYRKEAPGESKTQAVTNCSSTQYVSDRRASSQLRHPARISL